MLYDEKAQRTSVWGTNEDDGNELGLGLIGLWRLTKFWNTKEWPGKYPPLAHSSRAEVPNSWTGGGGIDRV